MSKSQDSEQQEPQLATEQAEATWWARLARGCTVKVPTVRSQSRPKADITASSSHHIDLAVVQVGTAPEAPHVHVRILLRPPEPHLTTHYYHDSSYVRLSNRPHASRKRY